MTEKVETSAPKSETPWEHVLRLLHIVDFTTDHPKLAGLTNAALAELQGHSDKAAEATAAAAKKKAEEEGAKRAEEARKAAEEEKKLTPEEVQDEQDQIQGTEEEDE